MSEKVKAKDKSRKKTGYSLCSLMFIVILLGSCSSRNSNTGTAEKSNQSGSARFVFSEEIHNFGSIKAGEVVSFTFVFKNEGTKDLLITGFDSGCGCTEVKIENKTVAPGGEGRIEVIYNSAGEVGRQLKRIILFSNADQPQKQIFIRANVTNDLIEINS